jgi:capsular exopolysaccharide synthesis family protein
VGGGVPGALRRLYAYSRGGRGTGSYGYSDSYGYGYGYGYEYGNAATGREKSRATAEGSAGIGQEVPDGADPSSSKTRIELMPDKHPRSVVAEAYRTFRNSVLLSRAGGLKSIVVTSALPREGKTTTAVNLAVVLGQLGKKVLLVDGDLHHRRVHEVLGISNRIGLVTILTDAKVKSQEAVLRSGVPNVAVLTAGPSSPNPSALLTSEGMKQILRAARDNFDYVVIDSPPVLVVSDAMILGHDADGVVLCVRAGDTPREEVIRARDRLVRSGSNLLGVLLNALPEGVAAGSYGAPYRAEGNLVNDAYGHVGDERPPATDRT